MQDSRSSTTTNDRQPSKVWSWLKNPWVVLLLCVIIPPASWVGSGLLLEYSRQRVVDALSGSDTVKIAYKKNVSRPCLLREDSGTRLPVWMPEFIDERLPERWRPTVQLVMDAHFSGQASDADVARANYLSELRYIGFDDATHVSEEALRSCIEGHNLQHLIFGKAQRLTDSQFTALSRKVELSRLKKLEGPFDQQRIDTLSRLTQLEVLELDGSCAGANLTGIGGLSNLYVFYWNRSELSDEQFSQLIPQHRVEFMRLGGTRLTSKSWPRLGKLKVTWLSLESPSIDDDALREFAKLKGLAELRLRGGRVTDAGIKNLSTIYCLGLLELDTSQLTIASARVMSRMDYFYGLRTPDGSNVTDEWLKHLARRELAELSIPNSQVTDAGVSLLAGEEELARLCLAGSKITDNCFSTLSKLKSLLHLDLRFTEITDLGLATLSWSGRYNSHVKLALEGTRVTTAGAREFLDNNPNAEVFGIEGIQPRSPADWIVPLPGKKTP